MSSEISASGAGSTGVGQRRASWLARDWLLGLILVVAVIVTYQPVWYAGFIWDDDYHLTANPCIVGPLGLKEIWTTKAADLCPLTLTTFWLEHALWGLAPLPYHLVNVLQHAACAVLLWLVLRKFLIPGAWLGAALWALHPVQVESVAWIAEMKNTQSCLFYLITILFYVRWIKAGDDGGQTGGGWSYALTLLFAALAMASKSSTVVLPVVLGLCAWWMEGRWQWRNLPGLIPIAVMSVAAGVVTLWPQPPGTAVVPDAHWAGSWPQRLVIAGDAVWFYMGKLVWPHPLITVYPRWEIEAGWWVSWLPLLAVIVVSFIFWHKRERWSRPWLFAWVYFLAALFPILGLVEHYFMRFSFVADHLQYLAGMGPLALAGAGLVRLANFIVPKQAWLQSSLCAGVLLILGIVSWQRAWVYENQETLWTDTLVKNPRSWTACNNLGLALFLEGRVDEAVSQYEKALEINPRYVEASNNLGMAFVEKGEMDKAIAQFQKALEINPNDAEAHYNLGVAFSQKGELDEATAEYRKALEINPNETAAYTNLGQILVQEGKVDEGMAQFQKALDINPNDAKAHYNLGMILSQRGEAAEAMAQFQTAVEINPNIAEAHYNLGNNLLKRGQVDGAIAQFQKAVEINPKYVIAHNNLGNALLQEGQLDAAIAQYQQTLEINPNLAEPQYNLGVAFARKGQADEAIEQYQKAVEINPDYAEAHYNLGLVLLQKGRVEEATAEFQKTVEISPNDAAAHNNLGIALAEKGKMDGALAEFQKALQLKPDFVDAQNNLVKVQAMMRQGAAHK